MDRLDSNRSDLALSGDRLTAGMVDDFQLCRRDITKDVQYRAMIIDGGAQPLDIVGAGRAVDFHDGADVAKPGPDAFVDSEESAQIEATLDLHRHVVKRDTQIFGIEAIGYLLAGAQRRQHQFHRVRPRAGGSSRVRRKSRMVASLRNPASWRVAAAKVAAASAGRWRKFDWVAVKIFFNSVAIRPSIGFSRAGPHDG